MDNTFLHQRVIAERLCQLRLQKNMSARRLSRELNLAESCVGKIENEKALPSMKVFFSICDYFKVTPAEFFNIRYPSQIKEVNEKLNNLNLDDLKLVNAVIDRCIASHQSSKLRKPKI